MFCDVLVVGAGPTGLMAAAVLAEAGADVRVIDQGDGFGEESRAAIVHVRTLETWDALGVTVAALAEGVAVRDVRVSAGGRVLARFSLAGRGTGVEESAYDHALALPQSRTERLLGDALRVRGGAVMWGCTLIGLEQPGATVRAVVRGPDGSLREIEARYVVGADGARSAVRHAVGIEFEGSTYAPTAFLADVGLDPEPPGDELQLNLARGGFVGALRIGPGRFRLFGALSPSYIARFHRSSEGAPVATADLQCWFDEYFKIRAQVTDVGWTSTYRVHQRIASRFRSGRVFLAGDAAHVHAPAGGQGMNLGIGDAMNLGWKLAAVNAGTARPELLDSYEPERRAAAQTILRSSDRGFALEASENRMLDLANRSVLPMVIGALGRLPAVRRMIFRLFSQTWITYRTSAAVQQSIPDPHGVQAGDRIPPALFHDTGATGIHHRILFLTHRHGRAALAEDLERLLAPFLPDAPIISIDPNESGAGRLFSAGHPRVVLVRPDGHAGYVGPAEDLHPLQAYLQRWYNSDAVSVDGGSVNFSV